MAKTHKWNMADSITLLRMVGSVCLLFPLPLSPAFFALYTFTGLTDVLDGWIARRKGLVGDFGAKLDSIADLLFYTVMLVRLLPLLLAALPTQIWYAVAGIVLLRLTAYVTAAIKYRCFASLHTWLNKLTGGVVFLLPYILAISSGIMYSWAICALAFASSLEELLIHLCRKGYCPEIKSLLQKIQGRHADEH